VLNGLYLMVETKSYLEPDDELDVDYLQTSAWDEHREIVARTLKEDRRSEFYWRELSALYAEVRALRSAKPGPMEEGAVAALRADIERIEPLYIWLTGNPLNPYGEERDFDAEAAADPPGA